MLSSRFLSRGRAGVVSSPPTGAPHHGLVPARPTTVRRFQEDKSEMPAAETSDYRKPYKILSLDGGGSWALIQAKVLKDLGYETGHQVLNDFDLVAANSGGSLVLGGLVANMELGEIENVFMEKDNRDMVFHLQTGLHSTNQVFGKKRIFPKYSTSDKLVGLQSIFTKKSRLSSKFNDENIQGINERLGFKADLLVPAYDYESKRGKIFRSNIKSKAKLPGDEKERCRFVQVMHASSNAPIRFFDKPATVNFDDADGNTLRLGKFWDGAIAGYNNPILLAVTEALANGEKPADIVALSIGAGTIRVPANLEVDGGVPLFGGPVMPEGSEPAMAPWLNDVLNEETSDQIKFIDGLASLLASGEPAIFNDAPMMGAGRILPIRYFKAARELVRAIAEGKVQRDFQDLAKMATTILDDPPDSASYMAYVVLTNGDYERDCPLVRLSPFIRYNVKGDEFVVPDALGPENFFRLGEMEMDAVQQDDVDLIKKLTKHWMHNDVPNQPVRSHGEAFQRCANGHETYGEAKEHWMKIGTRKENSVVAK